MGLLHLVSVRMWEQLRMQHSLELEVFVWKDFKREKKKKRLSWRSDWPAFLWARHRFIYIMFDLYLKENYQYNCTLLYPVLKIAKVFFFLQRKAYVLFTEHNLKIYEYGQMCFGRQSKRNNNRQHHPTKITHRVYGCKFILSQRRVFTEA